MSRTLLALALCFLLPACSGGSSGGDPAADTPADSLTRAQRDSLVAGSSLPGAGAVGRALDAAGTARERTRAMDSLQRR